MCALCACPFLASRPRPPPHLAFLPPPSCRCSFDRICKLLEEAFAEADGWTLLDAYGPTILRADSHAGEDGLHYCVPGPIDHWVTLLYNILLEKVPSPGGARDDAEAEDSEP